MRVPIPTAESFIRQLDKREDSNPGEFISVLHLEKLLRSNEIALPDDVSMPDFLGELLKIGWIETNNNGFDLIEQSFRISAKGQMRAAASVNYVEAYEKAVNALPMADENADYLASTASEPVLTYHLPLIDSSAWTGLPSTFILTEHKREALAEMLRDAESALDAVGASNEEKAMARAYIVAAKTLADAPEPPADLIWELINRANQISGVAALLVSIFGLFI